MVRYMIRREQTFKDGTHKSSIHGKKDSEWYYDDFFVEHGQYYRIQEYGFKTIPACKRNWAYKAQKDTNLFTVDLVRIIKFTLDSGMILREEV